MGRQEFFTQIAQGDVFAFPAPVSYASSITVDAAVNSQFYVTATGNLTIASLAGGHDGQRVLLEVYASGADRTVTVSSALSNMSGRSPTQTVLASTLALLGFYYSTRAARFVLTTFVLEP